MSSRPRRRLKGALLSSALALAATSFAAPGTASAVNSIYWTSQPAGKIRVGN